MNKQFLIIKTGGTYPGYAAANGDFEHWTAQGMGLAPDQWICVDVRTGAPLPDPAGFAGLAITGSHDMVTDDRPWIAPTLRWVADAVKAGHPTFGICFGHQLMAHALGGRAGYHPGGPEIGTVPVALTADAGADPLFSALPDPFPVHVTHSQTALELPPDAVLLASSAHEAHQAFRLGDCAWGVQFHPEFDERITRVYVMDQAAALAAMGSKAETVAEAVRPTPASTGLLGAFAALCLDRLRLSRCPPRP